MRSGSPDCLIASIAMDAINAKNGVGTINGITGYCLEERMDFARHVRVREEKFGSVIFETLKEKVFVTNETGRDILALMKEGKSAEEIIKMLGNRYNGEPEKITDDVTSFISLLRENNILV